MADFAYFELESDVGQIKGVGTKKKEQLESAGILSVQDLLEFYPVKYKDRRTLLNAMDASPDKDSLVGGRLIKSTLRPLSGRRSMIECTFRDESCIFYAVFFNMPFLKNTLKIGSDYVLFGRMKIRNGKRVWTNPEMSQIGSDRDRRGIIPVYRHTARLTDINLRKWITEAFNAADIDDEWIDASVVDERRLCSRGFAYRNIHFPQSEQHYKTARYRLIYEKLLMYQLAVRMSRKASETAGDASIVEANMQEFEKSLPFELTEGQKKCIDEIMEDMSSSRPMNRLVQGDVGCGKTVVAEAAIWRCAKAGMQSAMMAPTEILARQHYERLSRDLGQYGIRCVLLVSGMKAGERRETLEAIESGDASVVIGTHAIIQNDVEFNNLALVITDEQHRFGVAQRKTLVKKGRGVNVCVMSATPIPRTLQATVFGDMDFSIIRTMPGKRKKIITRALDQSTRERAYIELQGELESGGRAYIIAPSIDSEDDELKSVEQLYNEIKSRYKGYKTALLHGRMTSDEKSSIMNDFKEGRIQILVSTIVIEVGIDVPEASVIIIENSERFGLAQLHQLRGRVGRGERQSYCYIINYSKSETAIARARAMAEVSDGFEISEIDYKLRGPGDVMGTMQSGTAASDVLQLSRYTDILEAAIVDADRIVESGMQAAEYAYRRIGSLQVNDNSNII